ncbi:hypothetical protein DEU56DRAFT_754124 [Suillus clintonianus]|uniref:uncharacterized protein n=1 Tax=Suillus clintonianus TaxID=1904413 RepID=UPI001B86CC2B|nr:uncharacterized protein DEU56DRAFT_754124 [Suillus clintonianus]KAG2145266.1 hypothetical protein DEU56DRAFT_754124 [Suillus clintonianus]
MDCPYVLFQVRSGEQMLLIKIQEVPPFFVNKNDDPIDYFRYASSGMVKLMLTKIATMILHGPQRFGRKMSIGLGNGMLMSKCIVDGAERSQWMVGLGQEIGLHIQVAAGSTLVGVQLDVDVVRGIPEYTSTMNVTVGVDKYILFPPGVNFAKMPMTPMGIRFLIIIFIVTAISI